jgi:hypothetical protein
LSPPSPPLGLRPGSADGHAGRVSLALRAGAIAAVSLASLQTLLDALTSLVSVASVVLTAVTLAAVLVRRTPLALMWLVLVADLVQLIWYVSAFDNLVGGLFYGTLLMPFVLRTAAMVLALLARYVGGRPTTRDVTSGPSDASTASGPSRVDLPTSPG